MNARFAVTLFKWMFKVMQMLCSNAFLFSKAERDELAQLTADMELEIQSEFIGDLALDDMPDSSHS